MTFLRRFRILVGSSASGAAPGHDAPPHKRKVRRALVAKGPLPWVAGFLYVEALPKDNADARSIVAGKMEDSEQWLL